MEVYISIIISCSLIYSISEVFFWGEITSFDDVSSGALMEQLFLHISLVPLFSSFLMCHPSLLLRRLQSHVHSPS